MDDSLCEVKDDGKNLACYIHQIYDENQGTIDSVSCDPEPDLRALRNKKHKLLQKLKTKKKGGQKF